MKKFLLVLFVIGIVTPAFAISDVSKQNSKNITPVQEQNLTLGVVQKDIKIGTSQADVAEALGSPNIVTRDADGKDTWIYDKMSSVTSYNNSGFSVGAGGFGGGLGVASKAIGGGGGLLNLGFGSNKGGVQTNNKTLTVVIKFDKNSKVESFTYHMSSF